MSKHEVSKPYFPGFTRKSVTFTIDDGNLDMDEKFISIVAPYGIKGTFNLCGNRINDNNRERALNLYRGFEISNHCSWHPFCFPEERRQDIVDAPFDETTADTTKIYPFPSYAEGIYTIHTPTGWRRGAFVDDYLRFAEESRVILENVFGKERVKGFVWPFGKQSSVACYEGLVAQGYPHIRITGASLDKTAYAFPDDYSNWTYNANCQTLRSQVPVYESFPDDGELKFFCFGVHSVDYERAGNWEDVELFCQTFGNRPDGYYTAGVDALFHYSECAKQLIVTDDIVENPTDTDIYIKVDGEKFIVRAYTKLELDTKKLIFM